MKELMDIDIRTHINNNCYNYNSYSPWAHFKMGIILCIALDNCIACCNYVAMITSGI